MTRKSRRELERELEDLGSDSSSGIYIVGEADSTVYPTPEEFEQRHGFPPGEADGVVITVPAEAEGY